MTIAHSNQMTIPAFDSWGNLPPGIHYCSWDEFINRFETTPRRRRLINSLTKVMTNLKNAGCRTIYINGSFTKVIEEKTEFKQEKRWLTAVLSK